jgi:hypothetical protein
MAKRDIDDFEELDLGLDDDMGYEDNNRPSSDRKASIFSRSKNYAKSHYKAKFEDRNERKRLLKQAIPGSYGSAVDLAFDMKDDYDSIKYEVSKEWQKSKGPFKKLLKSQEGTLRALRLKKLADWANEEDRGRYAEEAVDQDDALTANLMGDFTKYKNSPAEKEKAATDKVDQKEKESDQEFKSKTLSATLKGTANLTSILKELQNQTSYQDQITFQYQRKNLEFNIRNFIESKKQTELLRTYKEEAISELKEIHKNTALPDAVKINQSELAGQIFKEKMLGNVASYFDGKMSTMRRKIVSRVKDRLLELTRDMGTNIEGMLEAASSQQESGGGSLLGMFGQMFADSKLDKPYNYVTGKATKYIRNKLGANTKINKFGKGLNSLIANAGTLGNEALITGKTGNKLLDGLSSFLGLNQAATTRSTRLRNSLSDNLDTATYMDVKFKQTVERVIPGWLSLIHKETYLTRIGSNSDKDYKKKSWDWDKEDFDNDQNVKDRAFTKVFKKENIEQFSMAMENVLRVYDPIAFLTLDARNELKDWIYNKIQSSRSPSFYNLMLEINTFKNKATRAQLIQLANFAADIHEEDLEYAEEGLLSEGKLIMRRPKYAEWAKKAKPYIDELASRPLFDINELMRIANTEQGKVFEEMGLVTRDGSGNLDMSVDYEKKIVRKMTSMDYKQIAKLKEGEGQSYRNNRGQQETRNRMELDNENMQDTIDDWLNSDARIDDKTYAILQTLLNNDTLDARSKKANEKKIKNILSSLIFQTNDEIREGKKSGRIATRAAGGIIPSFAKGGKNRKKKGKKSYLEAYKGGSTGNAPVDEGQLAIVHGQEFVTDATTTENNETLLELMNKFKAPVFLPDGKVNPVYYKAMGYEDEEEFRKDQSQQLRLAKKKLRADKFSAGARTGSAWVANKVKGLEGRDNSKTKEKIKAAASEITEEGKRIFDEAYKALNGMSEQQLQSVYSKLMTATDSSIFNASENALIASDASTHKKVLTVIKAKLREENRTKIVAELAKALGSQFYKKAKDRLKTFLNGGTEDTATTDNLKQVYNFGKNKVTGAYGEIKNFAGEQFNKTALKGRYDQAKGLMQKAWKELAIDIYLVVNPALVRLSAAGFESGMYIDKATGRVLESHHDINGEVVNTQGNIVLTDEELGKGLLDKEGNRINPSSLARYRNIARNKAVEAYNKYAKKHVDKYLNKGADLLLTAAERWQRMFKETVIDVYVTGKGDKPILTAVGFRAGEYLSTVSKKVLTDYLDIDGPVMTKNGQYLLLAEDLGNLIDKDGKPIKPTKLGGIGQRLFGIASEALGLGRIKTFGKKMFDKAKAFSAKKMAENFSKAGADAVDVYLADKMDTPTLYAKEFREGLYLDQATGEKLANHYMIKGPVIKTLDNGSVEVVLTAEDLQKGFVDAEGKPLPVVKVDFLRGSFFKGMLGNRLDGAKGRVKNFLNRFKKEKAEEVTEEAPTQTGSNKVIYYKDPLDGGLLPAFDLDAIKNWELYQVNLDTDNPDATVSRISDLSEIQKGFTVYRLKTGKSAPADKPMTVALLNSLGFIAVRSSVNQGVWFDEKGKKFKAEKKKPEQQGGQSKFSKLKGKLGSKLGGLKDKLKGKFTDEEGNFRIGSWQWKRKKKEEDGWFGRLGSALGLGKKKGDENPAKPSWLKTMFGWFSKKFIFMGLAAAGLVKALGAKISLGSMAAGLLAVKGISWALKKSLTGLVFKPLMNLIPWLGTKIMGAVRGRGMMGNGIGGLGKVARIGGAALGAHAIYKGLKGEEQFDENGDPIVDSEGNAVVKKDYMGAALGAVGVASMIPGVGGMAMSAGAALLTNPVGWAILGGVAVGAASYWLGKKALGWWKKGNALEESPLSAFRMIQYGFSPIDDKTMQPILQLEGYLSGMLVSGNDGINISNQVDPNGVFGIFGLKYGTGDAERNKSFLAWFLGRFKPVYLSYVKQMNAIKKTYKLDGIDTSVTAADRLSILENVHFKNQTDMNPYNIPVSPFEDPDETDYDFDDVCDKYDDVKSILGELVPASDKSKEEAKASEEKKEGGLLDTAKKALMFASPLGAAVMGLKWTAKKIGDVFNVSIGGMQKSFSTMMDKAFKSLSEKWEGVKGWAKNAWNSITNLDAGGMADAAKDVVMNATPVGLAAQAAGAVGSAVGSAVGGAGDVISKGWRSLTGKTGEMQKAVYESFIRAGLTPNQAKAITAEVGRENDYNPSTIFGTHVDPASGGKAINNIGMISWNGPRAEKLAALLRNQGLLDASGKMVQGQAALDVQTKFAVSEMKGPYAKGLTNFLNNPNGDPESFAQELGKKYIVWAYGQTKLKNGKSFDWKAHDDKRRKYLQSISASVGTSPAGSTAAGAIPPTIAKPGIMSGAATGVVAGANAAVTGNAGSVKNSSVPMIGIGGTDPTKAAGAKAQAISKSTPINAKDAQWDLDKIAEFVSKKTKGTFKPGLKIGQCALYVRQALQAGDLQKQIPAGLGDAWQLGAKLKTMGWAVVGNINTIKPLKGDIGFFDKGSYMSGGKPTPYGHVCIFTGSAWISDFTQASIYPGSQMAKQGVKHEILRAVKSISNGKPAMVNVGSETQPSQNPEAMGTTSAPQKPATNTGNASAPAAGVVAGAKASVAAKGSSSVPMIGIGGSDPTKASTSATGAVKVAAAAAGGDLKVLLAKATPELVAAGKLHHRLKDKKVTLAGMNETFMTLFWAMLGEARQKGLGVVQINEGVRTLAEQRRLYALFCAGKGPLAAKPGTSRHGFGQAMDINTVNADELDKKGLLAKWGFSRPLMKRLASGKLTETWHIENKFVKRDGCPAPQIEKAKETTSGAMAPTGTPSANTSTANAPAANAPAANTGNASVNAVVNAAGYGMTNTVSNQQQTDSISSSSANDILTRQLEVQTQIRNAVVELKDFIVKPVSAEERQRLEEMKKPADMQSIGEQIGKSITEAIGNKLSGNKSNLDLQKPRAPISVSKF